MFYWCYLDSETRGININIYTYLVAYRVSTVTPGLPVSAGSPTFDLVVNIVSVVIIVSVLLLYIDKCLKHTDTVHLLLLK